MSTGTLYLKIGQNVKITDRQVTLGEISEISCSDGPTENRVKTLRLPVENIRKPGRYVYSVMDVIGVIQKEYPQLTITNLGGGGLYSDS